MGCGPELVSLLTLVRSRPERGRRVTRLTLGGQVGRLGCPPHLALSLPTLLGSGQLGQLMGGVGAEHTLRFPPLQETSQSRFNCASPCPLRPGCLSASCWSRSGLQLPLVFCTVTGVMLTKGPSLWSH